MVKKFEKWKGKWEGWYAEAWKVAEEIIGGNVLEVLRKIWVEINISGESTEGISYEMQFGSKECMGTMDAVSC